MRLVAAVEYQGTHFYGWQKQVPAIRTVQQSVEQALSLVANENIRVFCAGRTDTGVHAKAQIIHFDTTVKRPLKSWLFGCNRYLPKDANLSWLKTVDDDFHARFSAHARCYQYRILNQRTRSSLWADFSLLVPQSLDVDAMARAASVLQGKHNFSAFRSSVCQAKSPVKTIEFITLTREDNQLILTIKANAFLHHMVRNIVGSLLMVGKGVKSEQWLADVLVSGDRTKAGMTAPAQGLYFMSAFYPSAFGLTDDVLVTSFG